MTQRQRSLCPTFRQGTVHCIVALACCFQTLALSAQTFDALDRLLFDARPLPGDVRAVGVSALPPSSNSPAVAATSAQAEALDVPASANDDSINESILPPRDLLQPQNLNAETVDLYLDAIADEQLDSGPFAPELLQQFISLGESYQQQQDHTAALEAFADAEYISRINNGLYAPEQFDIVENMIESLIANGDMRGANEKQQYLLFLNQQYYGEGSLQVVPALHTLADWNMDAFRSMLNLQNDSGFAIGFNSRSGGTAQVPNPRALAFSNLYQAQDHYHQAILNLVDNEQFRSSRLVELEHSLIEAIYLGANRAGILDEPEFYLDRRRTRTGSRISRDTMNANSVSFINGRNAWTRLRIYQENNPASDPLAIAQTIIGQGDWYMLFNRRLSALSRYEEAWRFMQSRQLPAETIARLLSPALPQQLPVFTPLPHSREKFGLAPETVVEYDGYIDLSFRITRFGNVRNVQVTARSENATASIERRLKRLLRSSPFRPRVFDGAPAHDDHVAVRYYFAMM